LDFAINCATIREAWQLSKRRTLGRRFDVGVMAIDRLALMADDVHRDRRRHPGVLEQAGRGMA
jgi:hypothetical protein